MNGITLFPCQIVRVQDDSLGREACIHSIALLQQNDTRADLINDTHVLVAESETSLSSCAALVHVLKAATVNLWLDASESVACLTKSEPQIAAVVTLTIT